MSTIKPPMKRKTQQVHRQKEPSDLDLVKQNIFNAKSPEIKAMWETILKRLEGMKQ